LQILGSAGVKKPILKPVRDSERNKTMLISAAPIPTTGEDAMPISKPGETTIPIINGNGERAKKGTKDHPSRLRYKPRSFFNALPSLLRKLLGYSKDPEIQAEMGSKVV
jgi:hypothetical protein